MLFFVYERFKTPGAIEIYRRSQAQGRMLPDGLQYVSSWVDLDYTKCFQLMETDDERLFDPWISRWKDLVEFEIFPVRTSAEAMKEIAPRL